MATRPRPASEPPHSRARQIPSSLTERTTASAMFAEPRIRAQETVSTALYLPLSLACLLRVTVTDGRLGATDGTYASLEVREEFRRLVEAVPREIHDHLAEAELLDPRDESGKARCRLGRAPYAQDGAEGVIGASRFIPKLPENSNRLDELSEIGVVLVEGEPAVATDRGPPQGRAAHAAHEDGGTAGLRRAGFEDQPFAQPHLLALEGMWPAGPAPLEELNHLIRAPPTGLEPVA